MWTRHIKVQKVTDRDIKKQQDQLILEKHLALFLNNDFKCKISLSRWAKGYLFSEGCVSFDELLTFSEKEDALFVSTSTKSDSNMLDLRQHSMSKSDLFQLTSAIQEKAVLFKKTAITESAALFHKKDILTFSEDVSRLGALDKAIGKALEENSLEQTSGMFISAKIDEVVVKKAVQCGCSIIISRVGVTDRAYDLANESGVTLIGFARGLRFNLYTHQDKFSY